VHEYYFDNFLKAGPAKKAAAPAPAAGGSGLKEQLVACQKELKEFIDKTNCNPIMVRLAWHDSGTFDQRIKDFPQRGGANGAIRFDPEMNFGANAGLAKAKKYLDPFKAKYPLIGWADLIQMGSALGVEAAGGPKIAMKYGRVSAESPSDCVGSTSREGFAGNAGLPDPMAGGDGKFPCGATAPAAHLRNVFTKKMGFTDAEIVALSGAHTIGRAFKDRSGTCPFGYTNPSKYTKPECKARKDGKDGVGMAGGAAWTKNWLTFDNSYYTQAKAAAADADLLWYPTDAALHEDAAFKTTFDKFAADQDVFFAAYAQAHKKLSELGSKFEPAAGITL